MRGPPRTLIVELVGLRCALEILLSPGQKNNHSLSASTALGVGGWRWESCRRRVSGRGAPGAAMVSFAEENERIQSNTLSTTLQHPTELAVWGEGVLNIVLFPSFVTQVTQIDR